jgi:universal stress protein F
MYKKILIAVAPEHPESVAELLAAARTLAAPDARIEALSVVQAVPTYIEIEIPKSIYEKSRKEVAAKLDNALGDADDVERLVGIGTPSKEIVSFQKSGGHDLVVMRSHGPTMKDYVLGSTASRVVRNTPCSIHIIR